MCALYTILFGVPAGSKRSGADGFKTLAFPSRLHDYDGCSWPMFRADVVCFNGTDALPPRNMQVLIEMFPQHSELNFCIGEYQIICCRKTGLVRLSF